MPKIPTIDNEDFEIKQEIKKQKDDGIHEETDLARLKDETYKEISKEIEFYFGRENFIFLLVCSRLGLNKDDEIFIDFLSSDIDWFADLQGKHAFNTYRNGEYFLQ